MIGDAGTENPILERERERERRFKGNGRNDAEMNNLDSDTDGWMPGRAEAGKSLDFSEIGRAHV